jgi:energy-coupling factor transporter ATP-binding protein EcfA2/Flp pilus assembly protein TadG
MKNGTASRNFWHDSGGAAALLFGLSLPVLAAATGAAIDYNGWIKQRSELQVMADRAALAGAKALLERYFDEKTARESAALAAAESTIGQTRPGALSNIAIVDGGSAVKVDIQEPPVIYFAKLLGFAPASLGTTAIAVVADSLPVCVIALAPTAPNALSIMGNAGLDASPCVVWVNSSAAQALRVGSNATLRAMRNCVVGGVSASGNVLATPRKCDVYPDPLAKWIQPQAQHCDYVNFSVSSSVPVTLSAGTYCGGINVTASDVTFGPGTYIVRDGPLKVSGSWRGSSSITCTGGLSKSYAGGKKVLENIHLSFYPDAKIGVLGPNGSGKSTLLKIMAGIDKEFGEAWVAEGARVGYLPQEPQLDPTKTCAATSWKASAQEGDPRPLQRTDDELFRRDRRRGDGLQDQIDAQNLWDLDAQVEQAMDALRCPPGDSRRRPLSGGEKRRVALCRLLLEQPDLLLLDEPTNHLDAETTPGSRAPARLSRRGPDRHPRPLLPRQRHRLDPRARSRPRHPLRGQLLRLSGAEGQAPRQEGPRGRGAPEGSLEREREWIRRSPQGPPGQVEGAHPGL